MIDAGMHARSQQRSHQEKIQAIISRRNDNNSQEALGDKCLPPPPPRSIEFVPVQKGGSIDERMAGTLNGILS